jgi:hypothetical protein
MYAQAPHPAPAHPTHAKHPTHSKPAAHAPAHPAKPAHPGHPAHPAHPAPSAHPPSAKQSAPRVELEVATLPEWIDEIALGYGRGVQ